MTREKKKIFSKGEKRKRGGYKNYANVKMCFKLRCDTGKNTPSQTILDFHLVSVRIFLQNPSRSQMEPRSLQLITCIYYLKLTRWWWGCRNGVLIPINRKQGERLGALKLQFPGPRDLLGLLRGQGLDVLHPAL